MNYISVTWQDFTRSCFPPLDLESIISVFQKDYLRFRLAKSELKRFSCDLSNAACLIIILSFPANDFLTLFIHLVPKGFTALSVHINIFHGTYVFTL